MQTNKLTYLEAMGIQTWQLKNHTQPVDNSTNWECLRQTVKGCTKCALAQSRTQTVFGVGSEQAELMVIGEAPGFNEDQQGEPFVGRAGQLLTAMLRAVGFSRNQVFIANVIKCRPPNNRDPLPEEIAQCTPFLEEQIALVKPKVLLAVGKVAAHHLLKQTTSMAALRNQVHQYQDIPLVVTYHPAYLLRSPKEKRKAFEDLQRMCTLLQN